MTVMLSAWMEFSRMLHDDRRRDVVWQIADDLHITGEIPQLPLLVDDPIEIGLQNILID